MVDVFTIFGDFMHYNLFFLHNTFQVLVRFNESERKTCCFLLKNFIKSGLFCRTIQKVGLNVVFRACWEYIVKDLDRVSGILLVDNRILYVETWNLATDAVFLDEGLFI